MSDSHRDIHCMTSFNHKMFILYVMNIKQFVKFCFRMYFFIHDRAKAERPIIFHCALQGRVNVVPWRII